MQDPEALPGDPISVVSMYVRSDDSNDQAL
jgi:hypothetical protein